MSINFLHFMDLGNDFVHIYVIIEYSIVIQFGRKETSCKWVVWLHSVLNLNKHIIKSILYSWMAFTTYQIHIHVQTARNFYCIFLHALQYRIYTNFHHHDYTTRCNIIITTTTFFIFSMHFIRFIHKMWHFATLVSKNVSPAKVR